VLLVEDSEDDYRLICELLDAIPHTRFAIEWARDLRAGLARLGDCGCDVCVIDHGLPGGDGLELVRIAQTRGHPAPMIMVTGFGSLDLDRQALALGVAGFLDKNRLDPTLLERTIRYAISQRGALERLQRLAQRDELTGLANRALFQDRLERALAFARRHDRLVAVMLLDLNAFKRINDELGHAAGDLLLKTVAARLASRLRETDTVARLGGDEFALVIEHLAKPDYAALVAQKVLDALAPPIRLAGQAVALSASLGIALYPRDAGDAATLVRQADQAMYQVKRTRRHEFRFHSEQIESRVQYQRLLGADLARALACRELVLQFHAQVGFGGAGPGLSAQACWAQAELGPIDLEHLLPQVEDRGLLEQLTGWLLQAACQQAARWQAAGVRELHLGLPLWLRPPIDWPALLQQIEHHCHGAGLGPQRLELDLSEEQLLAALDDDGAALRRLRHQGVRIGLAGFGAGLASLKALRTDLIDTIKLHPDIHRGLPGEGQRESLLKAVVTYGRELGLRVVACGVEDERQFAFLRQIGCDAAENLLRCPPLPAEACTAWLQKLQRSAGPPRHLPPVGPAPLAHRAS
jgi:diguanylate cyclase (GGDEF)-like protein